MFDDVRFTPSTSPLVGVDRTSLAARCGGLYNAAGARCLTKFDFAILVADVFGLPTDEITAVSIDDSGLNADRPKDMALSSARLSTAIGTLPSQRSKASS